MQKRHARLQLHRTTLLHLDPAGPLSRVLGGIVTSCGEVCTCEPCDQEGGGKVEELGSPSYNIVCTC